LNAHGQILSCTIEMEPAGKEEARRTRFGNVYNAAATRERMNQIRRKILACYQGPLLDEPVKLEIRMYRTRPKVLKKGTVYAAVKPDWDNAGKLIGDCIQGTVLVNDSRIAVAIVEKYFAAKDESPRIEITISRLCDHTQERRKEPVEDKIFKLLDLNEEMSLLDLASKLGQKPDDMLNSILSYDIPYEEKTVAS
jgi:Holliday junction resolvase RusA-like endonuclease